MMCAPNEHAKHSRHAHYKSQLHTNRNVKTRTDPNKNPVCAQIEQIVHTPPPKAQLKDEKQADKPPKAACGAVMQLCGEDCGGNCGCGGCNDGLAVVLAVMIGLCPKASSAGKNY